MCTDRTQVKSANLTAGGSKSSITSNKTNEDPSSPKTPAKRVLSYLTLGRRNAPRIESGLNAESIIPSPPRSEPSKRRRAGNSSPSPSPKKRRTTRAAVNGDKEIDYDMKHHPMDDMLRPKAAAKRSVRFRRSSETYLNGTMVDKENPPAAKENSPAAKDVENPFNRPIRAEWEDFEPFDRRIYVLQKGAPVEGNTLPHTWPQLVNILVKERFFIRKQLKAWGGVQALKKRYEQVRIRMQTLFAGEVASFTGIPEDKEKDSGDVANGEAKEEGDAHMEDHFETAATSKFDEDVEDKEMMDDEEEFYSAEEYSDISAQAIFEDAEDQREEISQYHRDEVFDLINDFFDGQPGDQDHSKVQTVEIHLSDDGSLPTGSNTTIENKADNSQSPPSRLEATEEREEAIQGMVVDNHSDKLPVTTIENTEPENASEVTAQPIPPTIGAKAQGFSSQVDNEIASDHVADISGGSEDVLDGTKSKLVDSDPAELSHGISSRLDEGIAVQVPEHKVLLGSPHESTKLASSDMIDSIENAETIAARVSKIEEVEGAQGRGQDTRKQEQIDTFLKVLEKGESLVAAKEGTSKGPNEDVSMKRMQKTLNAQSPKDQTQRKQRSGKLNWNETDFQVYEDRAEGGIIPPRTGTSNSISIAMDLPKENIDERGELHGETTTEQLLSNLGARTNTAQRRHRDQTPRIATALPFTDGPSQAPPRFAASMQALPAEHSTIDALDEHREILSHHDGAEPAGVAMPSQIAESHSNEPTETPTSTPNTPKRSTAPRKTS